MVQQDKHSNFDLPILGFLNLRTNKVIFGGAGGQTYVL